MNKQSTCEPVIRYYKESFLLSESRASDDSKWQVNISSEKETLTATFSLTEGELDNCAIGMKFNFADWSTDNYVCMPAAVYAATALTRMRFRIRRCSATRVIGKWTHRQ